MNRKILIVEDNIELNKGLQLALESISNNIYSSFNLEDARSKLFIEPDLIILDLNLPDGNGIDFIKEIRKNLKSQIIVLSAKDLESTMLLALRLGADDYITKPCSLLVLKEKVKNLLNRLDLNTKKRYIDDHFNFDFYNRVFKVDNIEIILSNTEIKLLNILVSNKNNILTKNTLLEKIWHEDYVDENTLSVSINRLRNKIKYKNHIVNEYGVGYKWR